MIQDWFMRLLTLGIGLFMMLCGGMGAIATFNSLRLAVFAPPFHPRRSGRFMAQGVVRATDPSQVQTTPLSHTACVAYRFAITEIRGRKSKVFLYTEYRGRSNISLSTENGVLQIDRCELDFNDYHANDQQHVFRDFLQARSHTLLAQHNISSKNAVGARRSLSITESILREGDAVYAVGRQVWVDQKRIFKDVIVTDKPIRRFIMRATVMFAASILVLYLSVGVVQVAFR